MHHLRNNKDIVILSGVKDSSVVVMNIVNFVKKIGGMINEGIQQGKYEMTTDTIHEDFKASFIVISKVIQGITI